MYLVNSKEEAIFNGKERRASCHPVPYYTDYNMHDLKAERFYKQEMVNGMMMAHDGMIKTFPLKGIKDSPPYLHDGRCFTFGRFCGILQSRSGITSDSPGKSKFGCVYACIIENGFKQNKLKEQTNCSGIKDLIIHSIFFYD
jgi:hypothetical protein